VTRFPVEEVERNNTSAMFGTASGVTAVVVYLKEIGHIIGKILHVKGGMYLT
jgi:hypothetical protein